MNPRARHAVGSAVLAVASLALAACASPLETDGALTVVPWEVLPGGRITIAVRIDDSGPYRFAVDTAATGSFLFPRVREVLGLAALADSEATVYGAVASGRFPIVAVGQLAVGDVVWHDARLIALPSAPRASDAIDGVLGTDFLRRYTAGFDVRARRLSLYRPDRLTARSYRGWQSLALESRFFGNSAESLHFLEIAIADRRVPALFDLGAGVSVLNPAAARELRLAPIRRERAGEFAGALASTTLVAELSTQPLTTQGLAWRNESFLIGDLPIFATLGYTERPLAILGIGLFSQRDFIIDFAHERLLVRASMTETASAVPLRTAADM